MRFEYEKSPLHTFIYGGTGTGKTYFVRQYLKLYLDQDKGTCFADNKNIIRVVKDERDWIIPETGKSYTEFNMCDINMITSKNKPNFENSLIVLDDMGNKLIGDMAYYFTEGRHQNIQMIVMCHKPVQIFNTGKMSCDSIYLKTYNGADLFKNFNEIYKCEHKFYEIVNDLNSNYYNCTDGMSDELRYGMSKYNKRKLLLLLIEIEL